MAERKPLVFLDNNLLGELPVGDHIAVNWGNISGIPANITAWAAIAPSSKADDSAVVHNTGIETIAGSKTFTNTIFVTAASIILQGDGNRHLYFYDADGTTRGLVFSEFSTRNLVLRRSNSSGGTEGQIIIGATSATYNGNEILHFGNFNPAYAGLTSNQSNRITDFASLLSNGLSTIFSAASGATGNPVGNATAGIHLQYQSGTSFDLAVTTTINPRLYVGSMSSGIWNEAWTSGNFNPALKADLSAVVTNGSNQTGIVGTKEWLNAQTFVGSVTSQHISGTGLVIERTNASANSSIEYRGTGGSIWAGLRNAFTWSINDVANLGTTPWFDSTATAAFVNGSEIWHAGNLADSGWQTLTLGASWTNQGGSPTYGPAACRKFGSHVMLRGLIVPGTQTDGTTICTLPSGYRPSVNMRFGVYSNTDNGRSFLEVGTDGTVKCYSFGGNTFAISLCQVTFFIG